MSGRNSRRAGITLVETLLAVVLLSLGAVAVLKAMTTVVAAAENARDDLRCNALLRERWADWNLAASTGAGIGPGTEEGLFSGVDAPYRWRLDKQWVPSRESVLAIDMTVWRVGSTRRAELTTWQALRPAVTLTGPIF